MNMDVGTYRCGPYPRWKYHANEPPRFITSEYEEQGLGEGWFNEYQKQDWPQLRYNQDTGEARSVANPDEEGKLEGNWSDKPPERREDDRRRLYSGNVTLEEIAQRAKSDRRKALDYEQLNDEMELKADNTAMKPLKTHDQPRPQYHEESTPKQDKDKENAAKKK
jgi:hypothetical protein